MTTTIDWRVKASEEASEAADQETEVLMSCYRGQDRVQASTFFCSALRAASVVAVGGRADRLFRAALLR